jgi:hypothetical protein
VLKLLITSRTRSALVNDTLVIAATSTRRAESHDLHPPPCPSGPELRCTIRSSRSPSSFEISRTYKPSDPGSAANVPTD